jgi:hypothetical protein
MICCGSLREGKTMRTILVLLICCTLLALGAQIAAADELDAGVVAVEVATDTPAATVPDIEGDPVGSIDVFVTAVRTGNWKMVGSIAIALIMLILGKVRGKVKFFAGDRGGSILVMILGLLGGLSAALAAGADIDWRLVVGIVATVWTAVGGVNWAKRIIWPKDEPA